MSKKEDSNFNLTLFAAIAYFIWLDRNNQIFQKTKPLQAKQTLNQAMASIITTTISESPQRAIDICLPSTPKDYSILITDGSFMTQTSCSYATFSMSISPLFMGVGCNVGLLSSNYENHGAVFVLSDCKNVVAALNIKAIDLDWKLKPLVEQIKILAADFILCFQMGA